MKTNWKLYIFIGIIVIAAGTFLLFFFKTSAGYTLNYSKEFTVDGNKVVFKAKAKPLEMEIDDPNIFEGEKGVVKTFDSEVLITIDSDKKVNCTYDLIYIHDEDYIRYNKTSSPENEFTISYDGAEEKQIENFGSNFLIGNFNTSGPKKTDTKKIVLKFYNLDEDQRAHINTVYRGNLKVDNVKCF